MSIDDIPEGIIGEVVIQCLLYGLNMLVVFMHYMLNIFKRKIKVLASGLAKGEIKWIKYLLLCLAIMRKSHYHFSMMK